MDAKLVRIVVAILMAMLLLTAGHAFAGADDLAKQANKIIRNAERNMYSGKNEEADGLLKERTFMTPDTVYR
jgi:Tfp pilus assembly protein PilO